MADSGITDIAGARWQTTRTPSGRLNTRLVDLKGEGRIRWILRFEQMPLEKFPEEWWHDVVGVLAHFNYRPTWPSKLRPQLKAEILEARNILREALPSLVEPGVPYEMDYPAGRLGVAKAIANLYAKPRRLKARGRGRKHRAIWWFEGALAVKLLMTLVDLLNLAGAERLMRCPYTSVDPDTGGTVKCQTIFLATRRQVYCSVEHSRAAAMKAFREREQKRRVDRDNPQPRRKG